MLCILRVSKIFLNIFLTIEDDIMYQNLVHLYGKKILLTKFHNAHQQQVVSVKIWERITVLIQKTLQITYVQTKLKTQM